MGGPWHVAVAEVEANMVERQAEPLRGQLAS